MASKSLLAAGALCALLSTGFAATGAAHAAAPQPGMPFHLQGAITSIANAGPTETLTVRGWSVTLAATTAVEMRSGAATTSAALIVGDLVRVDGTVSAATPPATYALAATTVRDLSLIDRATGISGAVRSIYATNPPTNTSYQMVIAVGHRSDDGFIRNGQILNVNLTTSTPVTLLNTTPATPTAGSIASIAAGNVVRVAGLYDAAARALVAPDYVEILASTHRDCDRDDHFCRPRKCSGLRCARSVAGRLIALVGAGSPATLRLRLDNGRVITALAGTSTVLMRRYDGTRAVDQLPVLNELQVGDKLQLKGAFQRRSALVFDARSIEDVSLQIAFTGVTVRLTSFSQVAGSTAYTGAGIVLGGRTRHTPYRLGQRLALQFSSNAQVTGGRLGDLANLRYAQHVHLSGLYDRNSGTLLVLHVHLYE